MTDLAEPTSAEDEAAALDPRTGRRAGPAQAAVLLGASCMPILGAVLLAPGLPSMARSFSDTAGVDVLVPLVLAAPALTIAITAPFAGRFADWAGRKGLLIVALLIYSLVGMAPLVLDDLYLVLVSRLLVGVAEGAIMTCCTALITDYWLGARRQRMLGLQVVVTSFAALLFFALGGLLVSHTWRTPFWMYAVGIPLALSASRVLWQTPVRRAAAALPRFPWRSFRLALIATFVGGFLFYVAVVELAFRLDDLGLHSPAAVGLVSAGSSVTSGIAAFAFARLSRVGPAVLVCAGLVLTAVSHLGLGLAPTVAVAVVANLFSGFGSGLMLPAVLSWATSGLEYAQRGRGTGYWVAALFLGEFLCPLIIFVLTQAFGGLAMALCASGTIALLCAAVVLTSGRRARVAGPVV